MQFTTPILALLSATQLASAAYSQDTTSLYSRSAEADYDDAFIYAREAEADAEAEAVIDALDEIHSIYARSTNQEALAPLIARGVNKFRRNAEPIVPLAVAVVPTVAPLAVEGGRKVWNHFRGNRQRRAVGYTYKNKF
jgi:hypothetical protein